MNNLGRWCAWALVFGVLPSCGRTQLNGGATDQATGCAAPTVDCGLGVCVDLAHDPGNCGACGRPCAADQFCSQGACVTHCTGDCPCTGAGCAPAAACAAGQLSCPDAAMQLKCVDPQHDINNCGACENQCAPGSRCEAGQCCADALCCQAPLKACQQPDGLACTDTAWNDRHCGSCDNVCDENTTCVEGVCEACSPLHFFPPVAEEVGELQGYVSVRPLVADVDGDGQLDVVAASSAGSSLTLTRGDGHGGFAEPQRIDTLVSPRAVVAGDFDGDGKTDLAVLGPAGIMVHLAQGNGDWWRADLPVPGELSSRSFFSMTSADVMGDARPELVFVTQTATGCDVYVATHDGQWQVSLVHSAASAKFKRVRAADLDGDGFVDLAAWDKTGDVLRGDGSGAFQLEQGVIDPMNRYETPLFLVDLNGDHRADMLTAEAYGEGTLLYGYYFRTHLARAGGGFDELPRGVAVTYNSDPLLTLDDFDHDGNLDLFARGEELSELDTFRGVGDGTFESAGWSAVPADQNGTATGDFDQDGKLDLVALHAGAQAFTLHRGQGDGTFDSSLLKLPEQTYLRGARAYHYADRASPSIVVVGGLDEGRLGVLELNASLQPVSQQQQAIYRPQSLSLNDVDGDGSPDALVPAERALYWARYAGNGQFATPEIVADIRGVQTALSADVTDSGRPKVFATSWSTPGSILHVLTKMGSTWQDAPFDTAAGPRIALGDVTGDGLPELVVASSESLQVFRVDDSGAVEELAHTTMVWHYPGLELADLDGDFNLEIVVGGADGYGYGYAAFDFGPGSALTKLAEEATPRLWTNSGIFTANGHVIDLDGDGRADFLESKGDGMSVFWKGRGDGHFDIAETYRLPGGRELVGLTDFDADGLDDMLLRGSSDYNGSLLLVRGAIQCQ